MSIAASGVLSSRPSARWRRWLRLGPSRADLARWLTSCEKDRAEAFARARAAEKELRRLRRELSDRFTEPPPNLDGSCSKIRFLAAEQAERFAARLADDLAEPTDTYHAYACKACPRHPGTMERFWHVGHRRAGDSATARERRSAARIQALRSGNLIRDRVTPEVLAGHRRGTHD
jgi:hypothetical protein